MALGRCRYFRIWETYLGGADLRNSHITLEGLEAAFLVGATMPDGTIG